MAEGDKGWGCDERRGAGLSVSLSGSERFVPTLNSVVMSTGLEVLARHWYLESTDRLDLVTSCYTADDTSDCGILQIEGVGQRNSFYSQCWKSMKCDLADIIRLTAFLFLSQGARIFTLHSAQSQIVLNLGSGRKTVVGPAGFLKKVSLQVLSSSSPYCTDG